MSFNIFVYTAAASLERAIVPSLTQISRGVAALPDAVIGSARDFNLYLLSAANVYDPRSGDASYTPRIGAGPIGGVAAGGSFPLSDGTDTSTAIAFDATAEDMQTILNAVASGTGPSGGTVTVTKPATGVYVVRWNLVGARTLLTGDSALLTPESGVVVDRTRTGDGATKEEQTIRLARQPVIYADGLTPIENGWSGTLSANNARALGLLSGAKSVSTDFEIEIEGPTGPPDVVARSTIRITGEIVNVGALVPSNFPNALLNTDPSIPRFMPSITGLTGGTAADLDGITPSALTVGQLIITGVTIGAGVVSKNWQVKTSASRPAEDTSLGIIHCDGDSDLYFEAV